MYDIDYYETPSGRAPVRDWLDKLIKGGPNEADLFDVTNNLIGLLEEFGPSLSRPHSSSLRRLKYLIYELRVNHITGNFRILYSNYKKTCVLLHVVSKKRSDVKLKDIQIANKRMDEWVKFNR